MDPEKHTATGQHLEEKLRNSLEHGKESVSSCCDSICSQSSQLCQTASDAIRRNPISSVIGAAFVGAAVAYLIMENRREPTFADRYLSGPLSDAGDTLSDASASVQDSLRSIYNTFKFW